MEIETKIIIGIIGLGLIITFHYCLKMYYDTEITKTLIKSIHNGSKTSRINN